LHAQWHDLAIKLVADVLEWKQQSIEIIAGVQIRRARDVSLIGIPWAHLHAEARHVVIDGGNVGPIVRRNPGLRPNNAALIGNLRINLRLSFLERSFHDNPKLGLRAPSTASFSHLLEPADKLLRLRRSFRRWYGDLRFYLGLWHVGLLLSADGLR
jgi:hypothetical protein